MSSAKPEGRLTMEAAYPPYLPHAASATSTATHESHRLVVCLLVIACVTWDGFHLHVP